MHGQPYIKFKMPVLTWSLTLKEGQGLRVFKHRVQSRIFGHKREAVKKSHNAELLDLYPHPAVVMGKSELKRAHGRHRHRREDVSEWTGCICHRTGKSSRLLTKP